MLLAIDGNEANVENKVGSNRFAFEVIWGIYRQLKRQGFKDKVRVFLAAPPRTDFPPQQSGWRYEVFGPRQFWTWTGLVKRLYFGRPRPDVLFSPSHYGPAFSPIPFVISVMDLGFLRWPHQFKKKDFYQLKYWTYWSAKRAAKVIAISKFTRRDIIRNYHLPPGKVVVAYPGYQKTTPLSLRKEMTKKEKIKILAKYHLKKPYFLFLGTLKPSKNIEGLISALALLRQEYGQEIPQLVIAGKKGWLYQSIFRHCRRLGIESKVIFTGFVADKEIPILMQNSLAFLLPSFWEGFGIPVLEAMAQGVPTIVSNRGSLPEVVDGASLIINPADVCSLAKAMALVWQQAKLRQELIKAGYQRQGLFSWRHCSKIILTTVKHLAEKK